MTGRTAARGPLVTVRALLIAIAALSTACASPPATDPGELALHAGAPAPTDRTGVTRTSGDSRVVIPKSPEVTAPAAALRSCARQLPSGAGDGSVITCGVLDELPDGTMVTMRCYEDGTVPRREDGSPFTLPGWDSPRWFLVTSRGGRHPGRHGYVYSGNIPVDQQVRTPVCDDAHLGYEIGDPNAHLDLEFAVVGSCTSDGGVLRARSAHFSAGKPYSLRVAGPDGAPVPVSDRPPVGDDGSVDFAWDCRGDRPGVYTAVIRDEATAREVRDVHFVVGNPVRAEPPAPTTPDPTPPPVEPDVVVTVLNQVTDGPTRMEDDTPAYLSTEKRGSCRRHGCVVENTEVGRGARLVALCRTTGEELTNGNDQDPADDTNPGRVVSEVWYEVRSPAGARGYISVVWLVPADRDRHDLREC
ncbi:hypothetical protein Q5530_14875 [Saccharothrix sp. BKS2]|uniref:hypothetical protein n=1 Tax=Saccharothrix sp. BKS2 TaxID=3064400 RepID=UPI0039E8C8AC